MGWRGNYDPAQRVRGMVLKVISAAGAKATMRIIVNDRHGCACSARVMTGNNACRIEAHLAVVLKEVA